MTPMCGWPDSDPIARRSRSNRRRAPSSDSRGNVLTATERPWAMSRARWTTPKPPRPISAIGSSPSMCNSTRAFSSVLVDAGRRGWSATDTDGVGAVPDAGFGDRAGTALAYGVGKVAEFDDHAVGAAQVGEPDAGERSLLGDGHAGVERCAEGGVVVGGVEADVLGALAEGVEQLEVHRRVVVVLGDELDLDVAGVGGGHAEVDRGGGSLVGEVIEGDVGHDPPRPDAGGVEPGP